MTRNKTNFFLIGMTGAVMALAFVMAGCEQGTNTVTKTVTVPGSGYPVERPIGTENQLRIALSTGNPIKVRITSVIELTAPLVVNENQHIIVGGSGNADANLSVNGGGGTPLFADNSLKGTLNITKGLTLKSGSSLTIVDGAAVNVKATTTEAANELRVEDGATVGVGVDVSGAEDPATGAGSLNVETNGALIFDDEATLALSAAEGQSKVKLEDSTGAITLSSETKLVVEGATATTPIIGGTAEGASVIIEVPDGSKAKIDVAEVYTAVTADDPDETVKGTFETAKEVVNEKSSGATPTYGIDLVPELDVFPDADLGYDPQTPISVTISNTGNQPTGDLTVALSGDNHGSFALSTPTIESIDADGSPLSFTVTPNTGLPVGVYTATVTVSGGNGIDASFDVSFEVKAPVFTTISEMAAYLGSATGGTLLLDPIPLKLNIAIDESAGNGLQAIWTALGTAGKFVALDLSDSTLPEDNKTFLPYFSPATGESKVVSLVLPNDAETIADGTGGNYTFRNFTAIRTVSGAGVKTIENYAFRSLGTLTSASFPEATSIGNNAFAGLTTGVGQLLTTVFIPKATTIGTQAFYYCRLLTAASFPAAESIGDSAFYCCGLLTEAYFPEATSMGASAFYECFSLTTAFFPKVTSLPQRAFYSTGLTTANFPLVTDIGPEVFRECNALTTASFPKATSVANQAFLNCWALATVDFPELISIGNNFPFGTCRSLTKVSFPKVTTIGASAFNLCVSLVTADFPVVTSIASTAFSNCPSLATVPVPKVE
jgi:hypothetical protein